MKYIRKHATDPTSGMWELSDAEKETLSRKRSDVIGFIIEARKRVLMKEIESSDARVAHSNKSGRLYKGAISKRRRSKNTAA